MGVKGTFFPWEYGGKDLAIIRGINFTPREIDIIACLIHFRGTRKVSSLLSISPNTVSSHMHNIMLKLGCNSRERIIDFIETSPFLFLLKEHYANLSLYSAFKKGLLNIRKDRARKHKSFQHVHLILCGGPQSEQKIFQYYLDAHLKDVGLHVSIKNTSKVNDIVEQMEKGQQNIQYLVLSLELDREGDLPPKLVDFQILSVRGYQNYYLLFFGILKKLLPSIPIMTHFQNFIERGQGMSLSFRKAQGKVEKEEVQIKNQKFFLLVISILFLEIFHFIPSYYIIDKLLKNNNAYLRQCQSENTITCIHSCLFLSYTPILLEHSENMPQSDLRLRRIYHPLRECENRTIKFNKSKKNGCNVKNSK